jgi:hypothetical protein
VSFRRFVVLSIITPMPARAGKEAQPNSLVARAPRAVPLLNSGRPSARERENVDAEIRKERINSPQVSDSDKKQITNALEKLSAETRAQ